MFDYEMEVELYLGHVLQARCVFVDTHPRNIVVVQ
jgi:hypothetical protein